MNDVARLSLSSLAHLQTARAQHHFLSSKAQHYAHAAMSLDLEYRPFYVEADERSVAARDVSCPSVSRLFFSWRTRHHTPTTDLGHLFCNQVRLTDKTQKRLVATVEAFVHNKEEPHHGHLHSDEL